MNQLHDLVIRMYRERPDGSLTCLYTGTLGERGQPTALKEIRKTKLEAGEKLTGSIEPAGREPATHLVQLLARGVEIGKVLAAARKSLS